MGLLFPLLRNLRDALHADHAFPIEAHDRMVSLLVGQRRRLVALERARLGLAMEGKRLDNLVTNPGRSRLRFAVCLRSTTWSAMNAKLSQTKTREPNAMPMGNDCRGCCENASWSS